MLLASTQERPRCIIHRCQAQAQAELSYAASAQGDRHAEGTAMSSRDEATFGGLFMCCPSIWVPVKEHAQVVGGGTVHLRFAHVLPVH